MLITKIPLVGVAFFFACALCCFFACLTADFFLKKIRVTSPLYQKYHDLYSGVLDREKGVDTKEDEKEEEAQFRR